MTTQEKTNKLTLTLNTVKKNLQKSIIVYKSTILYEDYCVISEMEIFAFRFLT